MEVSGLLYAPATLSPAKSPGIRRIGDQVGPRAGLEEKRKLSCPYGDSNTRPSSTYPSRYTDYAIAAADVDWRVV
jgi:hypothetical protein